ncbi:MAG: transcription elongation factor GreA [Candidatus Saccharimonadales bacterium]
MKKQFRLTKDGVAEFQAELDGLTAERGEVAERIKTAREFGDLSENAEYQSARQEQEHSEERISQIKHILDNVELIKAPKSSSGVQLGSSVKLKGDARKTAEFQVVSTVEADPLDGKISDESPIGLALLGKKVGDQVEIKSPAETAVYKIAEVG